MKCLTPSECSERLRERGIIESPFSRDEPLDAHCFQFEPPKKPGALRAFTRALFGVFGEFTGALALFTDWALYQPDEMALVASIRRGHDEERHLIDAPGHLFGPTEGAEAISHC